MGFNDARQRAIHCLLNRNFRAVDRVADPNKNLLATGAVSPEDVAAILKNCTGDRRCYSEAPHHDSEIRMTVHIFRTGHWYIKLYFLEPNCIFISVHR